MDERRGYQARWLGAGRLFGSEARPPLMKLEIWHIIVNVRVVGVHQIWDVVVGIVVIKVSVILGRQRLSLARAGLVLHGFCPINP